MVTNNIEIAQSLLGTLALECSMASVALRGARKRGSSAFEQTIQRIAVLTRQLEEIAAQLTETHQQLHLGIGEHYDAGG